MFDIPLERAEDAGDDGGICFLRFFTMCTPVNGKVVSHEMASVVWSLLVAVTALVHYFTFKLLRVN